MPVKLLRDLDWDELLVESAVHLREQPRTPDGRFAETDDDDDDDDDPFDAPYSEYNVNDDGTPRFSESYREQYGTVTNEYGVGATGGHDRFVVAVTDKGSLQVADDTNGAANREVVQEFTAKGAASLSNDLDDVIDNGGSATNSATGVGVQANGQVHPQGGYNGVDVTWANGDTTTFDPEESVELEEGLRFAASDRRGMRSAYGLVVVHPDPLVREKASQYLRGLPALRAFNPDQERDEKGRFAPGDGDDESSGSGKSGASGDDRSGSSRMSQAEFDRRVSDAHGSAADLPPVQAEIEAESSDSSTWKATGFEGLDHPVPGGTAAVTSYLRQPYLMNDRLRFPDGRPRESWEREPNPEKVAKDNARADRHIAAMDRLMDQSPMPSDAVVWRGMRMDDVGLPHDGDVTGFQWSDRGFVSTSGSRGTAEHDFAQSDQSALLRIVAPEGTSALGFQGLGESEVLLDRSLTFRVVGDHGRLTRTTFSGDKVPGARLLDVEVVPAAETRSAHGHVVLRDLPPGPVDVQTRAGWLIALDAETVTCYADGQSHALAQAIADAGGGQMVVWSRDGGVTGHAMVRTADDRRYVDVGGVVTLADMLALGWQYGDVTDIDGAAELGWDPPVLDNQTRQIADVIVFAEGRHVECRTVDDVAKQMYAEKARGPDHPGLAVSLRGRVAQLDLPDLPMEIRAFNPDQERDEKGRFAPGGGDEDGGGAGAREAAVTEAASSPLRARKDLAGGIEGKTTWEQHEKGTIVRKEFAEGEIFGVGVEPETRHDAEVLSSRVAEAVGVRAPAVVSVDDRTVIMEHVSGQTWAERGGRIPQDLIDSDEGRLLGLHDVLIANSDRTHGNIMIDSSGRLVAIDHGQSFSQSSDDLAVALSSEFSFPYSGDGGFGFADSIDMSLHDMGIIRDRLESLRSDFEAAGRGGWHDQMMGRLAQLESAAAGTRDRL